MALPEAKDDELNEEIKQTTKPTPLTFSNIGENQWRFVFLDLPAAFNQNRDNQPQTLDPAASDFYFTKAMRRVCVNTISPFAPITMSR